MRCNILALLFVVVPRVVRTRNTAAAVPSGDLQRLLQCHPPPLASLNVDALNEYCSSYSHRLRKLFDYSVPFPAAGVVLLAALAAAWPHLWFPDHWGLSYARKLLEVLASGPAHLQKPYARLTSPSSKLTLGDVVWCLNCEGPGQNVLDQLITIRVHQRGEDGEDDTLFYIKAREALAASPANADHEDEDDEALTGAARRAAPTHQRLCTPPVTFDQLYKFDPKLARAASRLATEEEAPRPAFCATMPVDTCENA